MKKKKILTGLFIGIGSIAFLSTIAFTNSNKTKFIKNENDKEKIIQVSICGAIEKPGTYTFNKEIKLWDLLQQLKVQDNADLSKIDIGKIINKNSKFIIPYKLKSMTWFRLNNIGQLIAMGVRNNIAKVIIKHRKQYSQTTWKQLDELEGVGLTTIKKLKKYLVL